ncbi:helix-turn-helix domain-containing protein [Vreelandella venusta]|uniref:Helix-turn-helix domain-containing protein n=1 Tax=Vreelandella venusta TaxID=44935 RepID=A0AAQ0CG92_9GAMM|nr:helix-turn-helix domain-containing protein [Halomonas venusta]
MSNIELNIEEHTSVQVGQAQGMSLRHIARLLGRALSTILREMRRNQMPQNSYCARHISCTFRTQLLWPAWLWRIAMVIDQKNLKRLPQRAPITLWMPHQ